MARARVHAAGVRQIVGVVAFALGLMAAVVSSSLILLTTSLHDESRALRDMVHGARVARETQADLLRHDRTTDPAELARLEDSLRRTLTDDFGYPARTAVTQATREQAKGSVERYLATTPPEKSASAAGSALESALDALEPVVHESMLDADEALARSSRLDRLSDVIGVSAGSLMLAVLVLVVLWTQTSVVGPMLALSDVMERFGRGDLAARASPRGAAELRRMADEFNSMGETLALQRRARHTHLAGVAHDLRNPLAALQLSAALVDPEQPLPPEGDLRRALALVQRQVGRLNRMVEDLLDAARIDAGQLELEPRTTDLRDVVREVTVLFEGLSESHPLHVALPDEPLVLRCDPLRIEQTLSNLVSNAIKYSPRGGAVRIRAYREQGFAKVSVSDEGVGIRPSDIDHIWEPFRRTGLSVEAIPGVGLGLWTARQLANAHQGTITVESEVGKGSVFTLALPLPAGPHG